MGKAQQLSEREKGKVDAYIALNLTKREISRRIRRSVCCITNYIKEGSNYGQNYKGKARALSLRDRRRLIKCASNNFISCSALKKDLNISASRWTIQRALNNANFKWSRALRKPTLTSTHKSNRLEFCRLHMNRSWTHTWFTDEKRFCLDGPDFTTYYWHDLRKDPVVVSKRQADGGGTMVWAGISSEGKTSLCFCQNTINAAGYQRILNDHFLPFYESGDFLVQDNAPIHSARTTSEWLNRNNVHTIAWPSRSPDLNLIENVWSILARNVYKNNKHYHCLQDLKQAILYEWEHLDSNVITKLISSMPDRIFYCIQGKGSWTKY